MIKRAALTLTAASALYAQSTVQGPTVGWIYDAEGTSLRAVLGVPGSSTLGPKVDHGVALRRAAVSPRGNVAIASAGDDGRMLAFDLRRGGELAVPNLPPSADDVVFSPNGSAALVIYRSASKVVVLPGFAQSGTTSREIAFGSEMPDTFAISDDAKLILAAGTEQVQALDSEGNRWNLNFPSVARSIAFLADSHNALIADARGLWLVNDASANAATRLIWEGNAAQALPLLDRKAAFVLTENQKLVAVNLESGASRDVECSCEPLALARMSESVIRVNRLSDGPLWLVEWNGEEPRAVFVPAEVKSEQ
jgi:WD40 repeat protein